MRNNADQAGATAVGVAVVAGAGVGYSIIGILDILIGFIKLPLYQKFWFLRTLIIYPVCAFQLFKHLHFGSDVIAATGLVTIVGLFLEIGIAKWRSRSYFD